MLNQKETAVTVYDDKKVKVETGVNANQEIKGLKFNRELHNCIKMTAFSRNAHFLQFVTRQVPDLFTFEESNGKTLLWQVVEPYYMTDSITPRWKVDATPKTYFYEEGGLRSPVAENFVSIYDYPGGNFEPIEERAIFCTFVIIDEQISHLVKWSKQNNVQEEEFYDVEVRLWNRPLPFWAIRILTAHCFSESIPLPNIIIPKDLAASKEKSEEEMSEDARVDFLQPHKSWITFIKYPTLFLQVAYREKLEEIFNTVGFTKEATNSLLQYCNLPVLESTSGSGSTSSKPTTK